MSKNNSTNKKEPRSLWHDLLDTKINRRSLMKGAVAATATAAASAAPIQLRTAEAAALETPTGLPGTPRDPSLPFYPIKPSINDAVILPRGFRQNTLAVWGDDIGVGTVGFNHDWIGYFPIDGLDKGFDANALAYGFHRLNMSSTDGILVINHEYINPMFVSEYTEGDKTAEQIDKEMYDVGMSVVRVQRDAKTGEWKTTDDAVNRRITALTPMVLTGPAAEIDGGPEVIGTLANCSGGMTPWGTALSCEENFQDYPVEAPTGYGWDKEIYSKKHYGWVVEVDPYEATSTPRKHTAMGRFRHENVAIRVGQDGAVVAYMGDDRADSCVYKFVADKKFDAQAERDENLTILEAGRLYVADFQNGKWILLDYSTSDALKDAKDSKDQPVFKSQVDVLADVRAAALAVRGTPVDRPEDIEINPKDGSVFIALTNNTGHGNFHGQIVRLAETDNNPASETFEWSIFAVGGPQSGFSSPDNLIFDGDGNLWMVTDVSSSRVNKGIYKFQANNAVFFFRTSGPYAGIAYQFASGPNESEMTGPAWTPNGRTMFLSVQHPGEESKSMKELSSTWPRGGTEIPRPALVAVQGFRARRA